MNINQHLFVKLKEIKEIIENERGKELSFEDFLYEAIEELVNLKKYDIDFYDENEDPVSAWDALLVKRPFENTLCLILLRDVNQNRYKEIIRKVESIIGTEEINLFIAKEESLSNYNLNDDDLEV